MKYLFVGSVLLLSFSSFKIKLGTREGTLTCRSESGRTLFNAKLEDGTNLESAEFVIDGVKNSFADHDNCYTIFDPANQVYTIWLEEKTEDQSRLGKFVSFWAIPSTFKLIFTDGQSSLPHEKYTFKAKIFAREPRKGFETNSKVIELNCTLELE